MCGENICNYHNVQLYVIFFRVISFILINDICKWGGRSCGTSVVSNWSPDFLFVLMSHEFHCPTSTIWHPGSELRWRPSQSSSQSLDEIVKTFDKHILKNEKESLQNYDNIHQNYFIYIPLVWPWNSNISHITLYEKILFLIIFSVHPMRVVSNLLHSPPSPAVPTYSLSSLVFITSPQPLTRWTRIYKIKRSAGCSVLSCNVLFIMHALMNFRPWALFWDHPPT